MAFGPVVTTVTFDDPARWTMPASACGDATMSGGQYTVQDTSSDNDCNIVSIGAFPEITTSELKEFTIGFTQTVNTPSSQTKLAVNVYTKFTTDNGAEQQQGLRVVDQHMQPVGWSPKPSGEQVCGGTGVAVDGISLQGYSSVPVNHNGNPVGCIERYEEVGASTTGVSHWTIHYAMDTAVLNVTRVQNGEVTTLLQPLPIPVLARGVLFVSFEAEGWFDDLSYTLSDMHMEVTTEAPAQVEPPPPPGNDPCTPYVLSSTDARPVAMYAAHGANAGLANTVVVSPVVEGQTIGSIVMNAGNCPVAKPLSSFAQCRTEVVDEENHCEVICTDTVNVALEYYAECRPFIDAGPLPNGAQGFTLHWSTAVESIVPDVFGTPQTRRTSAEAHLAFATVETTQTTVLAEGGIGVTTNNIASMSSQLVPAADALQTEVAISATFPVDYRLQFDSVVTSGDGVVATLVPSSAEPSCTGTTCNQDVTLVYTNPGCSETSQDLVIYGSYVHVRENHITGPARIGVQVVPTLTQPQGSGCPDQLRPHANAVMVSDGNPILVSKHVKQDKSFTVQVFEEVSGNRLSSYIEALKAQLVPVESGCNLAAAPVVWSEEAGLWGPGGFTGLTTAEQEEHNIVMSLDEELALALHASQHNLLLCLEVQVRVEHLNRRLRLQATSSPNAKRLQEGSTLFPRFTSPVTFQSVSTPPVTPPEPVEPDTCDCDDAPEVVVRDPEKEGMDNVVLGVVCGGGGVLAAVVVGLAIWYGRKTKPPGKPRHLTISPQHSSSSGTPTVS